MNEELRIKGEKAREAAYILANYNSEKKNSLLQAMADALEKDAEKICCANERDMTEARSKGTSVALLDRLLLTSDRVKDMADGLRAVASLPDPVGKVLGAWKGAQDLEIGKVRVPLGVIGIIYEARPNVTADAAGLCLKAGNAVLLRGGSEAINSNKAIVAVLANAVEEVGGPSGAIQLVENPSREVATEMMKMNQYLDVLIPRGGKGLIQHVLENATVPVIETGTGNCHIYVDESADLAKAEEIVINAKCQRPGVCNAVETLLVHRNVAEEFLPKVGKKLVGLGVEIRADEASLPLLPEAKPVTEIDYETEFLDLILAVKLVDSFEEATDHIRKYGTKHSEAILTESYSNAQRFLQLVDAAAVYVNASTRFTDGFQFGFGAEIGISTQKLHARGPMGLKELTSTKYIIKGNGQFRD